jgi:hypothetical protein
VSKRAWVIIAGILGGIGLLIGVLVGGYTLGALLVDPLRPPVRADYQYVPPTAPHIEGVVTQDFDPNKDPDYYSEKGRIAYSYPAVFSTVVGQASAENVRVAPYVVVNVTETEPMPERVDYAVLPYPGGGAAAERVFVATFSPERPGGFYAPQGTADAVPKTYKEFYEQEPADFFTLAEGEIELFKLDIYMVPGYFYRFRVGVPYAYRGEDGVLWSEEEYVAGIPTEAEVWLADWSVSKQRLLPFERVGGLEDLEEAQKKRQGRGYLPPPKYTEKQAAGAIERQNRAVREYAYPYTPPQEFDKAGE